MNVKERILKLNQVYTTGEEADIGGLLLIVVTKFQLFEPCVYLAENEEWLDVAIVSLENDNISQALSIKKSEITTLGIFNKEDIEVEQLDPKQGSEDDLYQ